MPLATEHFLDAAISKRLPYRRALKQFMTMHLQAAKAWKRSRFQNMWKSGTEHLMIHSVKEGLYKIHSFTTTDDKKLDFILDFLV